MEIKILGSGCAKCVKLYENTVAAARDMGIVASIEKVTDMAKIASYGVMSMPALVVDGSVASMGRVPSREQIGMLLKAKRSGR
jgi:small redox-active disulfide protein 2